MSTETDFLFPELTPLRASYPQLLRWRGGGSSGLEGSTRSQRKVLAFISAWILHPAARERQWWSYLGHPLPNPEGKAKNDGNLVHRF